jgi:hypothetical protein
MHATGSRGGLVGVLTRLQSERPRTKDTWKAPRSTPRPNQSLIPWVEFYPSPRGQSVEVWTWPLSSAQVKNECSCTSTSPYSFMTCAEAISLYFCLYTIIFYCILLTSYGHTFRSYKHYRGEVRTSLGTGSKPRNIAMWCWNNSSEVPYTADLWLEFKAGEPRQGKNAMPAASLLSFQGQTKKDRIQFSHKSEGNNFDGETF